MLIYLMALDTEEERIKFVRLYEEYRNRMHYTCLLYTSGEIILETSRKTADKDSIGNAKLVVFTNAPDDNPFMAGAFHGVTEADTIINVGVSGPGVVKLSLIHI